MEVLAFDVYNMADTGGVSKTLNSAATDTDHIPVVCYVPEQNHCATYRLVMFVANRYAQYEEGLPTLRASGGDIGGGSEGLIVYESISDNYRRIVCEQPPRNNGNAEEKESDEK